MRSKLIIDGNAVYEIDEECIKCKEKNTKYSPIENHPVHRRKSAGSEYGAKRR